MFAVPRRASFASGEVDASWRALPNLTLRSLYLPRSVRGDIVRGLTTAAIVWMTAAIGMACGAGLVPAGAGGHGCALHRRLCLSAAFRAPSPVALSRLSSSGCL